MLQVDARAHPDRRSGTGDKVHASGVPFDDTSGVRLRQWMGISREQFYNPQPLVDLPLGFCCPGTGPSGDLAPRRECAAQWRERLLSHDAADRADAGHQTVRGGVAFAWRRNEELDRDRARVARADWPAELPSQTGHHTK